MTPEIDALYPRIGRMLIGIPTGSADGITLYAEVEDGVISCNIFYRPAGDRSIKYRFGPLELDDVVYDLWDKWQKVPGNRAWRALLYTLRDKKFKVDFVYVDRFDETADVVKRRTIAAQQVLGKFEIDYSEAQPKV